MISEREHQNRARAWLLVFERLMKRYQNEHVGTMMVALDREDVAQLIDLCDYVIDITETNRWRD